MSKYFLCLLLVAPFVGSMPVDNGVVGIPIIECLASSIRFRVNTQQNFRGRLFVKNFAGVDGCHVKGPGIFTEAGIEIPFDSPCRIDRERSANPHGIFVTTTVVVSFHPLFITGVDKAYKIRCIYMAAEKPVNSSLDVAEMPAHLRPERVSMPICRYELLEGGPFGRPIAFATVGTQIYHKWTCDSPLKDAFCMLVHSCVVEDGFGQAINILDETGCAIDRVLLNNLEYPSDLVAGQETHVFKYADRDDLFFQCQISLTIKEPNSTCYRPQCQNPPESNNHSSSFAGEGIGFRKIREANVTTLEFEVVDVSSQLQTIDDFLGSANLGPNNSFQICLTKFWIIFVGILLVFLIIFCVSFVGCFLVKSRRRRTYQVNPNRSFDFTLQ